MYNVWPETRTVYINKYKQLKTSCTRVIKNISQARVNIESPRSALLIYSSYNHDLHVTNCCHVDHPRLLPYPLFFSSTILLLLLFFFSLPLLDMCFFLPFFSKPFSFFLRVNTLRSFLSSASKRRLATASRFSCTNRSFSYLMRMLEINVASK